LLAYAGGGGVLLDLDWFDRKGNRIGGLGEPGQFFRLNFSPDRKSLSVSVTDPANSNLDIWIYNVARNMRTRFTLDSTAERDAVWSPDGKTIIFSSARKGHYDLYRKPANGTGIEELLYADSLEKVPMSCSPDGRFLLFSSTGDPVTGSDLWILPDPLGASQAAKPYPFLRTRFTESTGQFSPDGRWIAYQSDESGRTEIYAAPFPGPGGKRQISTSGGTLPRWRADGGEIFYIAENQKLMAAEVKTRGEEIETGKERDLSVTMAAVGVSYQYDVSADGQRILAVTQRHDASEPLTIVQNWPALLKK
jgi:Tol biopolymer transport system component